MCGDDACGVTCNGKSCEWYGNGCRYGKGGEKTEVQDGRKHSDVPDASEMKGTHEEKDEIPPEIKQVIIGAVDLCERVSTWIEHAMDKSKSYEQNIEKAYDVCTSASKLYASIHKAFTWKDISNMMDDLGIGGENVDLSKDKIILPDGSVVSVGPRLAEVLKKGEKKDGEEGK